MFVSNWLQQSEMLVKQQVQRVFRAGQGPTTNQPLRTLEEIQLCLHLPVLGLIEQMPPAWPDPYAPQLETIQAPYSSRSEAFHALRRQVQQAVARQSVQTLLVISPDQMRGRAAVAANLAVSLAQSGQVVALLDADLHKPRVRHLLGQYTGSGLQSVLQDQETAWVRALVMTGVKNLIAVAAEPPMDARPTDRLPEAGPLLSSPRMQSFLQHLRTVADVVVIDAPTLATGEALPLARQADGAILVVEHGKTHAWAAQQAVQQLQQAGTRLLGAVLSEVPGRR